MLNNIVESKSCHYSRIVSKYVPAATLVSVVNSAVYFAYYNDNITCSIIIYMCTSDPPPSAAVHPVQYIYNLYSIIINESDCLSLRVPL